MVQPRGGHIRRVIQVAGLAFGVVLLLSLAVAQPTAEQTANPAASPAAITFAKDIAPIFQKNCQQCHQPDSIGPMSLMTYQEARPWARSIKQKVMAGEMPPYRYDRNVGIQQLKHDLRLSEKEIQTIARWVDSGAPQGNPADMPPRGDVPQSQRVGVREAVRPARRDRQDQAVHAARARAGRVVAADRSDRRDQGPLHQGRLGQAVARKDAPRRITPTPSSCVFDEKTGKYVETERVSEYALGKVGEIVPVDGCRTMPANSLVRWDVHYYPTGEELEERRDRDGHLALSGRSSGASTSRT